MTQRGAVRAFPRAAAPPLGRRELTEATHRIKTAASAREAVDHLARLLRAPLRLWRASLQMLDPPRGQLLAAATWCLGPTLLGEGSRMSYLAGSLDEMLRRGGPAVSTPSQHGPLADQILFEEGIRSCVSIPLVEHDLIRGALALGSRDPQAFPEEHLPLFSLLGAVIEDPMLRLGEQAVGMLRLDHLGADANGRESEGLNGETHHTHPFGTMSGLQPGARTSSIIRPIRLK